LNRDLVQRIAELEAKLAESEETLQAIARGEVDAVVVRDNEARHQIYTLENADRPYRVLIEQMQEGAVTLSSDGTVLYCNRRLAEMVGVPQERVIGQKLQPLIIESDHAMFQRLLDEARRTRARGELVLCRADDGAATPIYLSLSLLEEDGGTLLLCGVLTELTQQKVHLRELAEANARLVAEIQERERVENALRQSQKMEAVGQLTGGLAHDFNNLLAGISGSLELMQTRLNQGRTDELHRYMQAAAQSTSRAAALTHRLLAFSRRQTLDPKTVDGNRLVSSMEDLIRRTIGPAIHLEVVLSGGLWTILCDPNQLESALLNLAINARDAMPDGGRLTIETSNAWLDDAYTATQQDLRPGQYIAISVTDTGTGMSAPVMARAFDPFFTTKPIGQGTGLGLSMVYGFVKQSDGHIRIYSEINQGTTMRLYLPRHWSGLKSDAPEELGNVADPVQTIGSVLVVDDEAVVRMLVTDVLEDLGYVVAEAEDGREGLQILRGPARIDLLVTDVGLPGGMNGRQLADAARTMRPDLRVLFITGYAENAAVGNGHLDPGMEVMTKPFALEALAIKIRSMIARC
jgi:PAS domain S-box-containing protein